MLEYVNVTIKNKKRTYFRDISLSLEEGTILGIFGMDEAARSVFLQTTAGAIKGYQGRILLDGEKIQAGDMETAMNMAYMPRKYGFYDNLTVQENYEMVLALYRANGRYRVRRIEEVIELIGLDEYSETFISEVPAEVLPFVYLGKIILVEPRWLMLDEPFLNMSSQTRTKMIELILKLQELGMSMIINTTMATDLTMLFTDFLIFDQGKIMISGRTEEMLEKAMFENTIRMRVLKRMEDAIRTLKNNSLVERVIIDGEWVVFRFFGEEQEEANLLRDLILSGALIQNYTRDPVDLAWFFRG